jgi:hypothetical protein
MLSKLQALMHGGQSVSRRFALLSFLCVLAITVLVCFGASTVLRSQLVMHDGVVIGDLASACSRRAFPPASSPRGPERLRPAPSGSGSLPGPSK